MLTLAIADPLEEDVRVVEVPMSTEASWQAFHQLRRADPLSEFGLIHKHCSPHFPGGYIIGSAKVEDQVIEFDRRVYN